MEPGLGEKDRGYVLLAADDMPGDLRQVSGQVWVSSIPTRL